MKQYRWSRRHVIAGTAATLLSVPQASNATWKGTYMPDDTIDDRIYDTSGIDLNALAKFWPDKHPQPKLIVDIAHLIAPWPWGLLSHFYITGGRFNDHIVENGADLHDDFGIFIQIPNGSQYAIWYHEGCVPGAEPIVNIDDEGQFSVLAPNLQSFFTQWASGKGIGMLEPYDYDATPEILAQRHEKGKQILALIAAAPTPPQSAPAPDFYAYLEKYGAAARAANAADPTLQAIAKCLAAYVPHGKAEWEAETFSVTAKDNIIEVTTKLLEPDYTEYAPLPERAALIPLIQKARAERAQGKTASLGPWTSAVLRLYPDGSARISASWD
jgi:hypothetical protein